MRLSARLLADGRRHRRRAPADACDRRRGTLSLLGWWLLLAPGAAAAHSVFEVGALAERLPVLLGALALVGVWGVYVLGARRRPPPPARAGCFHAALAITAVAVFGPLDDAAQTSTSWHMLQHMLFMVVIAPLAALAHPLPQFEAAGGRAWRSWRAWRAVWPALLRLGRAPLPWAVLHGAVIWLWHTPRLYRLALEQPGWHLVEHAAFLLSAGLFWWSALWAGARQRPQALLALLLTLMHTGLLGALLAFGRVSFYGAERSLAEQQLAGLIMWVPGGLAYLAGAGVIAWRWLGREAPPRLIDRKLSACKAKSS